MILNGRNVRTRGDLTEQEIDELPEEHPWKHEGYFSYGGQEFHADEDDSKYLMLEEQSRKERARERRMSLESHYRNKAASGVPMRYHCESIDTYQARSEAERNNLIRVRAFISDRNNKVLAMCGGNGTGKTHLGCAVIRERGGIYKPILRLVYEVDSCMSFRAEKSKIRLLDELCEAPMLVLDEIGRGLRREQQQELVYYVLNERYANNLPTVIISNLGKKELVSFVGRTIKDRLNETCEFLEFSGESYRKIKRNENFTDF